MKPTTTRAEVNGRLRLELQDFKFVDTPRLGRALRLTVTLRLDLEDGRIIADSKIGCLVKRDKEGVLEFEPPMTRVGRMYLRTNLVSPDFSKMIIDTVGKSKYAKDIGTGMDYLKQPETLTDPVIEVI